VRELNHRVKNTLATVQAIAVQSFAGRSTPPAQGRRVFLERLDGLARVHDLIAGRAWHGAPLDEVLDTVLDPYGGERWTRDGPPLMLAPKAAVTLSMVFAELATNAAKYGALSVSEGRVAVAWVTAPEGDHTVIRVLWREWDGPAVTPPARPGFGLRFVEHAVAHDLAGQTEITFPPSGLTCWLTLSAADTVSGGGGAGTAAADDGAAGG